MEQRLQETKLLLQRCKGILSEQAEFQRLEDLVRQVQGFIITNKSGGAGRFSDDEKSLIRELFGVTVGEQGVRQIAIEEMQNHKVTLKKRSEQLSELLKISEAIPSFQNALLIGETCYDRQTVYLL